MKISIAKIEFESYFFSPSLFFIFDCVTIVTIKTNKKLRGTKDKDVIEPKNPIQNKAKDKDNNNQNRKIPYLNFLELSKVNKLKLSNNKKNIVLYSNIIKPFNSSVTLFNNHNSMFKKIKKKNQNIGCDNINNKKMKIINGRKYMFDLPLTARNRKINLNKSCFFESFIKLGKVNYTSRSKSAYIGSCFACDLGFSISRSGYSPMTFSPYDKKRREECGVLPKYIVYEQYTRHKKSKFYNA